MCWSVTGLTRSPRPPRNAAPPPPRERRERLDALARHRVNDPPRGPPPTTTHALPAPARVTEGRDSPRLWRACDAAPGKPTIETNETRRGNPSETPGAARAEQGARIGQILPPGKRPGRGRPRARAIRRNPRSLSPAAPQGTPAGAPRGRGGVEGADHGPGPDTTARDPIRATASSTPRAINEAEERAEHLLGGSWDPRARMQGASSGGPLRPRERTAGPDAIMPGCSVTKDHGKGGREARAGLPGPGKAKLESRRVAVARGAWGRPERRKRWRKRNIGSGESPEAGPGPGQAGTSPSRGADPLLSEPVAPGPPDPPGGSVSQRRYRNR